MWYIVVGISIAIFGAIIFYVDRNATKSERLQEMEKALENMTQSRHDYETKLHAIDSNSNDVDGPISAGDASSMFSGELPPAKNK